MRNGKLAGMLVCLVAVIVAGCEAARTPGPAPSPVQPPSTPPTPAQPTLVVFSDPASGFSTSDVRDAEDEIVNFNTASELIWTADDTHLPGYRVVDGGYIPCDPCAGWLEVRFGMKDGERQAHLTLDYGHDNPGSVVDLEVQAGILVVSQTNVFPLGTYTLSDVVTEMTQGGEVPVEGVDVYRGYATGWQAARTDVRGFYEIKGLYDRTDVVVATKEGYVRHEASLTIGGDTRFDIRLVRP
jgi:hypothetical protein